MPDFKGRGNVLDIGCGRGEFLELMREAGVPARGIDSSLESIALCHEKGLPAEAADLFDYLRGLGEGELDGIFCAQVVEHLPPERLPEMIRLAASRLERNGVIVIETPNPDCLAIFATYFYLDPTHARPVPEKLLAFYLSEFGIGKDVYKRQMYGKPWTSSQILNSGATPPAAARKLLDALAKYSPKKSN